MSSPSTMMSPRLTPMRKVSAEGCVCHHELWNNNHRPERVKSAFEASRQRLRLDHVDCYLVHTPFAFQPGDEQDPRDERGQVIYDPGVTLVKTWHESGCFVDEGPLNAPP